MAWLALIIPVIAMIVLRIFFSKQMTLWEFFIPLGVGLMLIFTVKTISENLSVTDTEYWGGWVEKAVYYEPWDERVSCTHAKYRTETYDCGDSKTPRTCTREVFDGYEHMYDVSYHPEHWKVVDSNNETWNIKKSTYDYFSALYESNSFVELNRSYHSIDGDSYEATWNGDWDTLSPTTKKHSYVNKVANSTSVYEFRYIDKNKTDVFDYPNDEGFNTQSVLSSSHWSNSNEIDKINASLGAKKKIRVWILIWEGKTDRQVAFDQEAYWKGGNKNELVICINVNSKSDPTVNWCHVFSWSDSEELKTSIKSFISIDNNKLDMIKLSEFLKPEIEAKWVKKNWHEFDYLEVQTPAWALVLIWALVLASTIGTSLWCIMNGIEIED